MNEREFHHRHESLWDALRSRRGACSELDALIERSPEDRPEDERRELERHLELCPICARIVRPEEDEIDDVTWRRVERRLDERPRPWLEPTAGSRGTASRARRPWMALAASLILVLGAGLIWRQLADDSNAPSSRVATTRGSGLRVVSPIGTVERGTSFRWRTTLPLELVYRVEVRCGDELLLEQASEETALDFPPELNQRLRPDVVYRWRVLGLDGERVLAESEWMEFEIRP